MLVEKYNELNRNNYSGPLDKYFKTKTLQNLKGKGQHCGMDYVGVKKLRPIEMYTRFDHSKNVGYTAMALSNDLNIAVAGALHDSGTLSFAHINSFKKGKGATQNDDEINVKNLILKDEELLTYLSEDGIKIEDVIDYSKYPLLDKEIPALCLDRIDGILITCLIWVHTHTLNEIKNLYNMLSYVDLIKNIDPFSERLKNFNGEIVLCEDGIHNCYEDFFKAINIYSKILLSKESHYMMEIFGRVLAFFEEMKVFNEKDLYELSENSIIERMLDSKYSDVWQDFIAIDKVEYAKEHNDLTVISKTKIREANPLILSQMGVCEIHEVTGSFYRELNNIGEDIKNMNLPMTSNLNPRTAKILCKYKKK